jgi:hypothetical protein
MPLGGPDGRQQRHTGQDSERDQQRRPQLEEPSAEGARQHPDAPGDGRTGGGRPDPVAGPELGQLPPQHPRLRPSEHGPFANPASTNNPMEAPCPTLALVAVAPTIAGMANPASSPQVVATTHRRYLGSANGSTLVGMRLPPFRPH